MLSMQSVLRTLLLKLFLVLFIISLFNCSFAPAKTIFFRVWRSLLFSNTLIINFTKNEKIIEVEVKEGTRVGINSTTESQRESYKKHEEDVEEYKEQNDDAFFHLIFKYGTIIFRELEEKAPGNKCNIHIIRFIILASYLTFGGKLLDDNGHRIKKSSLKKI